MDTVLAFFAGFLLTWPALVILVVAGIYCSNDDSNVWATFWLAIAGVVAYHYFNIEARTLMYAVPAYLVAGVLWSFWRYRRHVNRVVDEHRDSALDTRKLVLARLHPKAMLGRITGWIVVWPMSLIANLLGDLINVIELLVTRVFRGLYMRIWDSAAVGLDVK